MAGGQQDNENAARLAVFTAWLEENGADLSNIELRYTPDSGNCVYARQDIPKDTLYINIPQKLVITGKVCNKALSTEAQNGDCGLTERALLATFLVHERYQAGAKSFWAPYIDILPAEFHTPLFFNEKELGVLRGTPAEHAIEDRRNDLETEYRRAAAAVSGKMSEEVMTFERYAWAASAVMSRAFSKALMEGYDEQSAGSQVLLPLLDMVNHQARRRVTWLAHANGVGFVTGSLLEGGQQVFNNYGPKSNEELMIGYGFCLAGNEFSHFHIRVNYERDPLCAEKTRLLEAAGVGALDHYIRASGLPRDLLPMLRVVAMSDVDVRFALERLDSGDWGREVLGFVGLRNELRARHLLVFLLQKKLSVFEDGDASAAAAGDSINAQVARVYRAEIGSILRSTIAGLLADEHRLMRFACEVAGASEPGRTTLPWYARKCIAETDAAAVEEAVVPGFVDGGELCSVPQPADSLAEFIGGVLISSQVFELDEAFEVAMEQVDFEPDIALTLFIVRCLVNDALPWHGLVKRLEEFKHPMLLGEAGFEEMLTDAGEVYDSIFPLLSDHFPEVFPAKVFTLERFLWAVGIVETFSIDVPVRGEEGTELLEGILLV
ncbi:hypothetical protein GGI07_003800 [Coemansia sp. Benny D115]|nr:hypothetical protein GGI07_003800 [Coemansia sp. Benny D115]